MIEDNAPEDLHSDTSHSDTTHSDSHSDVTHVLMLDGKFGMVIRVPTEHHPMVGIQVDGEDDIRWREPSRIVGEPLMEIRERDEPEKKKNSP